MNDQTDLPSLQDLVRTEPVQKRSSERIELLLDAAADLIDVGGIDSLTTSEVATRSGSSVGVVYRYFPNIQSLLRGLAARNMERYTDMVFASLATEKTEWRSALDSAIDAYISLNRTLPGFRALRFGDVIDSRFIDTELSNNAVMARAFAGILGEKYDFEPTDALVFDLEVIVEIVDALMKRAFLSDRDGDERFLDRAREIARDYLRDHANLPNVTQDA